MSRRNLIMITAKSVKELREMTGAGMMDCKKALVETEGNMEKAIEFLREKGLAAAAKKAGRVAAEGIVKTFVSADKKTAGMVEVNCETDFVAANEEFVGFATKVAEIAANTNATTAEELVAEKFDGEATIQEALTALIAKLGENMTVRRFVKFNIENGAIASYIHGGGRIGVLVAADGASNDAIKEALTNVAMQIAAMNPQYLSRNDMSADELAKLREITEKSALNDPASLPKPILNKLIDKAINDKVWSDADIATYEEHKSNMQYLFNFLSKEAAAQLAELALADEANIVADKIFNGLVEGRVSKQLKEICLMDQVYVKAEDGKQSVAKYLAEVAKANGAFTVKGYVRFETGEGLEKKNEDFAAEVAAQLK